jgi:hypothetical protein
MPKKNSAERTSAGTFKMYAAVAEDACTKKNSFFIIQVS